MATRYQVVLKNTAGVQVALLPLDAGAALRLEVHRRVNAPDFHRLTIDGTSVYVVNFVLDAQVEVWRRDIASSPVIDWYREYEGFHRTGVESVDDNGQQYFDDYGVGYDFLIEGRHILYPAGSAQASKSGAGETAMKAYVNENAGPGATTPPRLFAGAFTGLSIQAGGGAGSTWTGERAYRNLLEVVQEIGFASLVDFKTVGVGAALFEFRAKASPWGADRSVGNAAGNAPVIFSLDFGNMGRPTYSLNRRQEISAAISLGQGIETDRQVIQRTDAVAIAASLWNRREATRQANTEITVAGLNAVGDRLLEEFKAQENFTFQVIQTPATLYGRDYFLGDIVTARFKTVERDIKIVGVDIVVERGVERIDVLLSDVS